MLFYLFLLVVMLPIVEITILVQISKLTAVWVPFAIVIGSAIAGAALARWQGWRVYQRIRDDAREGRMPADALFDGLLILLAGLLLIFPGVLTDVVGLALLIPPTRTLFKRGVKAWFRRNFRVRVVGTGTNLWQDGGATHRSGHDEIIDARVISSRVEDAERPR